MTMEEFDIMLEEHNKWLDDPRTGQKLALISNAED